VLLAAVVSGCGGSGAAPVDAGGPEEVGATDGPTFFRFSSGTDALLAAPEAGSPSFVCCDSEVGCVASPINGACYADGGAHLALGSSFRFWLMNSRGGISLTVETDEPDQGFTGACLLGPDGRLTDQAQLPVVCFSLDGNVQYDTGTKTEVVVPASEVVQSDTPATPALDEYPYDADYTSFHYQVLMTCYPHDDAGACTAGSAVSRSCCDVGANMQYLRENLVHGFVNLSSK
jgi:hypothetical protein